MNKKGSDIRVDCINMEDPRIREEEVSVGYEVLKGIDRYKSSVY